MDRRLSNGDMRTKKSASSILGNNIIVLIIITVAAIVLYRILNKHFLSANSIMALLTNASISGVLAVGLACLFISGQIDLSSGGIGCMGGILLAFMITAGLPWPIAMILTIVFGMAAGLLTAFMVNVLNITAFIATLAMTTIYQGLSQQVSNSQTMPIRSPGYWNLGATIGNTPIPLAFFIMTLLFVIYGIILARTKFGRNVYVCGGNPNAARLAGINPKKIHTILFINNGAIAALAGCLLAARMRSAGFTSVLGTEFDAITAVVLGGVAFTGGKGTMAGAYVGLMLMCVFKNGLIGLGIPAAWQTIAQGMILIVALSLDYLRERSIEKALKAKI